MIDNQILRNHRQEMAQKRSPVYHLFEPIEKAALQDEALAALRKQASRLAEFAVVNGLRFDPETGQTVDAIVQLGMPEAHSALLAWTSAVAEAHPSREAMHVVLRSFGQWLKSASPSTRAAFFEVLPKIASCSGELGADGIDQLLQTANGFDNSEDRENFLEYVGGYGKTSAANILGICRIADGARKCGRMDYLKKLTEIISPEGVTGSRDASKLIPAVAQLNDVCAKRGKDLWCRALDVVFTVAENNYSSAYFTAKELPLPLKDLSPDAALSYIKDFQRLVHAIGIRVVGFGTKSLPRFYSKYGTERTRTFVEATVLAAEAYGATAGQWFYERKTAAARELLRA